MPTWVSIIPPILTVVFAVFTRRILSSLVLGLAVGGYLVSPDPVGGLIQATDFVIKTMSSEEKAYIIFFLFLFGALAQLFSVGGGIKGFARLAERYIKGEKGALAAVWAATPISFLDCCFHVITTGTITGPLLEKVNGSKEKLAMIINITSSQLIVLIPVATTYVGYITGITGSSMGQAGIEGSAYSLYIKSIPFNFYSIGMVLISMLLIFFGLGFGKMKLGSNKEVEGGVHNEDEAHEECEFIEKVEPRTINLFLPMLLLLAFILLMFWYTGRTHASTVWGGFYERRI